MEKRSVNLQNQALEDEGFEVDTFDNPHSII
jgi:hypothetical protein